jgi:hypothetical protein
VTNFLAGLAVLVVGFLIGYFGRDFMDGVYDAIEEAEKPKPKAGVTKGSYFRSDEVNPQVSSTKARGKVVTPKTPQRTEWDIQQQLKEEQFKVKPK